MEYIGHQIVQYCQVGNGNGTVFKEKQRIRNAESNLILYRKIGNEELDKKCKSPVRFTYTVITNKGIYKNIEDGKTAGKREEMITRIEIKTNLGIVKYRVHVSYGDWLPYIIYDASDEKNNGNGIAGNGDPIDAVEITHNMVTTKYRVSPIMLEFYDYQKGDSMKGYAGIMGNTIDRFELTSE